MNQVHVLALTSNYPNKTIIGQFINEGFINCITGKGVGTVRFDSLCGLKKEKYCGVLLI